MHQNNADNDNDMSMLPCHLAVLLTTEQLTMIYRAVVNCLNPYMVYQHGYDIVILTHLIDRPFSMISTHFIK
jgi:hypothetical protein